MMRNRIIDQWDIDAIYTSQKCEYKTYIYFKCHTGKNQELISE